MKSMRLPLAAIFFMTYFHRAGGGLWPPRPPLDPLLDFVLLKAIQDAECNAHRPLTNRTCFSSHQMSAPVRGVSWSEQVWTRLQSWSTDVDSGGGGGPRGGPLIMRFQVWCSGGWRGLYSEVQCIMANGHTGTPFPDRMMDRHDRKHYLPATLLAGDNYPITLRYPAVFRVCTISSTSAYLMHGIWCFDVLR